MSNKIFIVEDDKDTQIFLKFFLGKKYELEFCDSADEFFESIKRSNCNLIIVDIRIKGSQDGLQITRQLKSSMDFSGIPVLCLTANVLDENKEKAFIAGADYFLTKPVENGILLNTIEMLLNKNRNYIAAAC
jgi:DNA-binding response OmpR family regulator